MAMTALLNAPQTQLPTTATILGEVVSPKLPPNVITSKTKMAAALSAAGLDPKYARGLCIRHAFVRALRKICKGKLLRPLRESATSITFEASVEQLLDRSNKTITLAVEITCDKGNGTVTSSDFALETAVKNDMVQATEARRTADVSRLLRTLLEDHADRFAGFAPGTYLIPQKFAGLIGKLETLMTVLGGKLNRLPIMGGTPQGQATVQKIVTDKFLEDFVEAMATGQQFCDTTRPSTVEKHAARIEAIAAKMEEYQEMIGNAWGVLEDSLCHARGQLAEVRRQAAASKGTQNVITMMMPAATQMEVACPACGELHSIDDGAGDYLCADCGKPMSIVAAPNGQGGFMIAM
jgi:hypothetical protein